MSSCIIAFPAHCTLERPSRAGTLGARRNRMPDQSSYSRRPLRSAFELIQDALAQSPP
ncbi:hypothetical protein GY45DRAFT_1318128 [Cubamyces sp. BRFM 1775]|nr:hypothetical protein GY45DRAFT_1318128 [Cubamyces sp. BRFM 1775]